MSTGRRCDQCDAHLAGKYLQVNVFRASTREGDTLDMCDARCAVNYLTTKGSNL